MKVIKRDGREVEFNNDKIVKAISFAMQRTEQGVDIALAERIAESISKNESKNLSVEDIQNIVENKLMASSRKDVAKEYITYRNRRSEERIKHGELYKIGQDIINVSDLDMLRENANLNGESFSGKMSKFASEYAKWYATKFILPTKLVNAIKDNYIHVHDLDQYAVGSHNCTFVPFDKLLNNGFSTGNGSVRKPNSIATAMAQVAIIFQSQQNSQYGGVGASKIDWDLEPFVKVSFRKHFKKGMNYFNNEENCEVNEDDIYIDNKELKWNYPDVYRFAYNETVNETNQGAESLVHNLNTMSSRAGGQIPFTSINYGTCTSNEGRMIISALLDATIKGLGAGETPIFPIQIFQCKKGINRNPEDKNYDLFLKAIECSTKRLYPNFVNVDAPFNLQYYKENDPNTVIGTMGCRTRVIADRFGYNTLSGKGNISFNTINLVKLGIESNKNEELFYEKLTEMLDITLEGLIHRYNMQAKQKAKSSDFMMREGVWVDSDKLCDDDEVGEVLKHGTVSIGFIGLAETMKALYGLHHGENSIVYDKSVGVIDFMRKYCDNKSNEYDMNISLFATPAEGLAGKFVKKDKKEFGELEGITDRDYYTNSFHIPVYFPIKMYEKIKLEALFHELCNAGAITYIELDGNARNNADAFMKIVEYALESNISYFAVNHPLDRCDNCDYEGTIGSVCPNCGINECETYFSRIRRVTGYLSGDYKTRFNSAKQKEVEDRVKHGS